MDRMVQPDGQRYADLHVDLDGGGRIRAVEVRALTDAGRRPEVFEEEFQRELTRLRAAALPPAPPAAGGIPVARRSERRQVRDLRTAATEALQRVDDREVPRGSGGREIERVTGDSDNACVRVELALTGPGGDLDIDGGWLANAEPANVGKAVTQAFAAAYLRKDQA